MRSGSLVGSLKMIGGAHGPESTAPDLTQLALDRTWLAHERTLMAWVRTATSMIAFAFTIYKFFQFEEGAKFGTYGFLTPRGFAVVMISIGLVALLLATFAHRRDTQNLSKHFVRHHRSLALLVATLVSIFGILVLFATVFRG
jgi:putative membrane protein